MSPGRLTKAARLILVGAPGVGKDFTTRILTEGKGTQSERLLKSFPQLSSVSSGDLLRDNVRNKTLLGQEAEKLMNSGALVPDAVILQLIVAELTAFGWLTRRTTRGDSNGKPATLRSIATRNESGPTQITQELESNDDPDASFILDGFPRTAAQASQLDALIPMNLVVHIATPTEIILDRITNRWVHAPSGRVYNTTFNPPKQEGIDDITGEPLTRRADDSPETWKARLSKFEETSLPLLEHYENKGILWRISGNSSDEITPKLLRKVEEQFGVAD